MAAHVVLAAHDRNIRGEDTRGEKGVSSCTVLCFCVRLCAFLAT